jgi:hypothetical protein
MEFHQVLPGKMFPIPGGVRNAKFLKQKRAFSSRLMNNQHQFFSDKGLFLDSRFFHGYNLSGCSIGQIGPVLQLLSPACRWVS